MKLKALLLATTIALPAAANAQAPSAFHSYPLPDPNLDYEHIMPQTARALNLPPDIAKNHDMIRAFRAPNRHEVPANKLIGMHPGLYFVNRTSTNWSGTVAFPGGNGSQPQMTTVTPRVVSHDGGVDWFAAWVGYGGYVQGDLPLGQGGLVETSDSSLSETWIECFPQPAIGLYSITPGDTIYTNVFPNFGKLWIYSIDYTSGASVFGYIPCSISHPQTNEWIVEAPFNNGQQTTLANYGQITMNGAISGGGIGAGTPGDVLTMVQNGVTASTVTILDGEDLLFRAYP
jgi:hypothetical protein